MLSPEEVEARADALPCADPALLGPLKRSFAYATWRKRLIDRRPVDSWEANLCHSFVFATPTTYVVFVMRWEDDEPFMVIEVATDEAGRLVAV